MKWVSFVKDERKRNSRCVCMGCFYESLVLGGRIIWWVVIEIVKEYKEFGEKKYGR